jgi:hypothetical protein
MAGLFRFASRLKGLPRGAPRARLPACHELARLQGRASLACGFVNAYARDVLTRRPYLTMTGRASLALGRLKGRLQPGLAAPLQRFLDGGQQVFLSEAFVEALDFLAGAVEDHGDGVRLQVVLRGQRVAA